MYNYCVDTSEDSGEMLGRQLKPGRPSSTIYEALRLYSVANGEATEVFMGGRGG